jgi:two-component system, LuxR family, response regulator FixJ
MTSVEPTVFVVDDDEDVRKSLEYLVKSVGLRTESYASAVDFLNAHDPNRAGCVVLDVRMPGMSGLELQERLAQHGACLPVIIITGYGDVPMAVRAIKHGAVDFIEKPFREQTLLECIQRAIQRDVDLRQVHTERSSIEARLATLTAGERQVMDLVVNGQSNKEIAAMLGLSVKAIEARRAKVMEKMDAPSLADLVKMSLACAEKSS